MTLTIHGWDGAALVYVTEREQKYQQCVAAFAMMLMLGLVTEADWQAFLSGALGGLDVPPPSVN